MSGLKAALEQHQCLNRALRVGRVDPLVVALLGRLASTQLSPHFRVVGTRRERAGDDAGFSAVIVATNGTMARMNTVHPATFVAFKRWMANQRDREALKRRRDVLQADAVQELLDKYLPPI